MEKRAGGVRMYLNLLSYSEKKDFIEIAYHTALSNNLIDMFQKDMLNQYHLELGSNFENYKLQKAGLGKIFANLKKSSDGVKKAIFLELMGICLCDKKFDPNEEGFMKKVQKQFNLADVFYKKAYSWTKDILRLTEKGNELIAGKEG